MRVPLDAALADECDVRRAATDIDEQRARLADLLVAEDARDGVGLGDDLDELEVELVGDRLERPEVDQRGEGVEDLDLMWRPGSPPGSSACSRRSRPR